MLRAQINTLSCCVQQQIFAEDMPEVEGLPRDRVLDYLERMDKSLVIPYLVCTSVFNTHNV